MKCTEKLDVDGYLPVKTAVEWLLSAGLLLACSPLLLVVAAAVKLTSRGPALYSQMRVGRNGRMFRIYKLRTMTHNCEALTGPVWSQHNDPRITRIGRFLRDTHLDELPQFWNVLRGEMSLIGPRPERPEIAAELQRALPNYSKRLRVRPGMSGLAQLRLPCDRDVAGVTRKLRRDLFYVSHVGASLDLRLGLETVRYLVTKPFGTAARALGGSPLSHATPSAPTNVVRERTFDTSDAFDLEAAESLAA